jgi:hypothetical protein
MKKEKKEKNYGSYQKGRRFEYYVISYILKHFPKAIIKRNLLSRKPDLIVILDNKIFFFEVKQNIKNKGKKMKCKYIDLVDYLNGKDNYKEEFFKIKDKFYTITKGFNYNKNLILIIPEEIDKDYLKDFYNNVEFYKKVIQVLEGGKEKEMDNINSREC